MKGILANSRFAPLAVNAASGAKGSDLILNEVDTGGAQNGTLVLLVNSAASSDAMAYVQVWTSSQSDFATSGSALSAVTSDGLRLVEITSDASYAADELVLSAAASDHTISSNAVTKINQDVMLVLECPNVSRYLNVQYDSSGTGSLISAVFIGHDLAVAPWPGARSAY